MATNPEVELRVTALIEELMDLIKPNPNGCGDPHCETQHDHIPEGPWMLNGWVMVVDLMAESKEVGDEVECWSTALCSKSLPWTQCVGMGHHLIKWAGG